MPSRISRLLTRSQKNKQAETDTKRKSSSSSSSSLPPGYDAENRLDPPDPTAGFSNLVLSNEDKKYNFPTSDEIIAHLKLLECFYRLRQTIGATDGLFGISNSLVTGRGIDASETEQLESLAKLAEKRWSIYVSRAVDRFDIWIRNVFADQQMANLDWMEEGGPQAVLYQPQPPLNPSQDDVPPLDVLMVWHAYMLNPRAYLEDCLRNGRVRLWQTRFPWKAVDQRIDRETFAYEPGHLAVSAWGVMTGGLSWSNFELGKKEVCCPHCGGLNLCDWSTCGDGKGDRSKLQFGRLASWIDGILVSGNGYCDQKFGLACTACQQDIDHSSLAAGKFRSDLEILIEDCTPMRGTLLDLQGLPGASPDLNVDSSVSQATLVPNKLLALGLREEILSRHTRNARTANESLEGIREMINEALEKHKYMRKAGRRANSRTIRAETIAIHRMMSRYEDNPSPFALDLVGAVIRQGSFIEKMHHIDWLHSPALFGTTKRLITKYDRFVRIMADGQKMAVPTLDVDLAWHTHQLSPSGYFTYTVKHCMQFIDHDDKVAEDTLDDSFEWTSKRYQKLYREPYSECMCWYCEARQEQSLSASHRTFRTANGCASGGDDQMYSATQASRPNQRISGHNAVQLQGRSVGQQHADTAQNHANELESVYRSACARARRRGNPEPERDGYYYSDAWGSPVYIPAYSPYDEPLA
ncbi:hypothetical protein KC331_g11296 [Hortaea werneckii]|uniref:Uncharacterized protein n=1 Tax=Hortaea werneckii TaxID=91943 RepID=A0A3M7C7D0_HORWE|nr:hypothetical protein KC331_g11296 [Hortaea werneckii]KAI7708748.1 hypothetical protein KC353_g10830 [Hortaea werneckii]RMY48022.1 hypothetical protein D0865_08329 [Hortaea werneckii]